jgi:dienelactone hydrolase
MTSETTPVAPIEPTLTAPPKRRRLWRVLAMIGGIIVLLLLLAVFAAIVYTASAAKPMPEAIAALTSDDVVTVTRANWLEFTPTGGAPTTGFIFYPGGHVDPRAYAPPARALAEQGYLVAITPMPLTLAILDPNRADAVINNHPEIERWYIGGHSLGGATAAIYADRHPSAVNGVIFWAAYPPDSNSLVDQADLQVTSVSGTLDGLATPADIQASKALVPPFATFVPIVGGNHAQFGYYGPQQGDNEATITRKEQQEQVIAATAATLSGR